jgi:hypothetical protein
MKRIGERKQLMRGSIDREANVALTYKFLKDGKPIKWIEDFFSENQGLKPITVRLYLIDARRLISTETDMDIDFASLLHDSRYEKLWEQEKDIYLGWCFVPQEPYERANNMEIVRRYSDLLKSLKQRENMYGLREKDLVLALHSHIHLTKDYRQNSFEQFLKKEFDLTKLSIEERVELMKLLEDSYEGDIFEEKDYITKEEEEEEIKEIKKIENPQNSMKVKIEGIGGILIKTPKKRRAERKTSSIIVKDFVKDKGSTPEQVSNKIEENQKKVIKIKFNKK